jgi:hypothetical protein
MGRIDKDSFLCFPAITPGSIARRSFGAARRVAMQDLVMIVFTALFFALAFGYVQACHRLR